MRWKHLFVLNQDDFQKISFSDYKPQILIKLANFAFQERKILYHNFQLIIVNNCPTIFFITYISYNMARTSGKRCHQTGNVPFFCLATKGHAIPKIVKFMTSSFPIFFYQSRKENTPALDKILCVKNV